MKPINVSILGLRVVKEKTEEYDLADMKVSSPMKIVEIMHEVFEMGMLPQEIFVILTLDTKNYVTGVF